MTLVVTNQRMLMAGRLRSAITIWGLYDLFMDEPLR